ncbi:uncharacterized protein A1O9_07931 [Exophiala aquamarina CBS 119918]|uniref:FAD-binding PCMH-type domain-containing protein n=1 Tax=Exophiala aquamarina CBS 119918 TaxID=1182545 RepID=A0A072PLG5_9EURO|nr:uncharacterized protein A1O9_07931 [Exophiala aquamarina CBS 119918]KEF56350.1 hypothetical protein A1O9_07931 [Exophiala aquamarina CBS 119918]
MGLLSCILDLFHGRLGLRPRSLEDRLQDSDQNQPSAPMIDPIFEHSRDRLQLIIGRLHKDEYRNQKELPGLADLLADIVDSNVDVDREESVRRLLGVFWRSKTDATYSATLRRYGSEEQNLIRSFVEHGKNARDLAKNFSTGLSLGAREELPIVDWNGDGVADADTVIGTAVENLQARIRAIKRVGSVLEDVTIYDDPSKENRVITYLDEKFQNWGRTVTLTPHLTFIPQTSYGVQQIVKYAKAKNMNVRAAGYRHTWSSMYGKNGMITISTLGLHKATLLPNVESLPGSQLFQPHTELNNIEFVGEPQKGTKRLVRVGTAVTNQMFRRWCNQQELHKASTLPLNVIMVEITMGGSNAPICHGAGRRHPSLSDLVHGIEYVDEGGNLRTINKDESPEFMSLAAGCFGLLGIVTHLTLELDPMSYAVMIPQKLPVMQAIPPPPGLADKDIPEALRIKMTPQMRQKAQEEFEKHARNDFYAEWFWFPYTSKVWVNCWNTDQDGTGAEEFPSNTNVFIQWVETVALQIIQDSEAMFDLQQIFPWTQATLISKLGLYAMPEVVDNNNAIKTQLPNALHFRRAIQNLRVRDMEMEIPLQPKKGALEDADVDEAEINWTLVQKAWWDGILAAYKYKDQCPQRMPLEMRITGPSNVTMAPFRGHRLGTCSIEILTLENMKEIWLPYAQYVLDRWMDLKDNQGNYLATRPHWAKEWESFTVRGRPMIEYMQTTYRQAIGEFRDTYSQIAAEQNWKIDDARERFSNVLLDQLLFN